jgi:hypothetical protein
MAMDAQAMIPQLDQVLHVVPVGVAWVVAGLMIGTAHFMTLRWNAALFAAPGALAIPVLLQLVRLLLTGALLLGIARLGGVLPLLLTVIGILIARAAVVHGGNAR